MLGRLFRWLGYVPVSSLNLMPGDAASPAVAPHRHRASAFEFDRAHLDNLCYSYSDGDFSYLAVGRDDWAPLAVAGFSLVSQPQCRAWLNENLRSRVWVGGEALESWHAENRPVFAKVVARPDRQFVAPINLAMVTDIGEKDQVPLLEASEIAECSRWRGSAPASRRRFSFWPIRSSMPRCWITTHFASPVRRTSTHSKEPSTGSRPGSRHAAWRLTGSGHSSTCRATVRSSIGLLRRYEVDADVVRGRCKNRALP
jgi:hypothetical protein